MSIVENPSGAPVLISGTNYSPGIWSLPNGSYTFNGKTLNLTNATATIQGTDWNVTDIEASDELMLAILLAGFATSLATVGFILILRRIITGFLGLANVRIE